MSQKPTRHVLMALRQILPMPKVRNSFNPGVCQKLERDGLAEIVVWAPSPYQGQKGKLIQYLRITDAGRAVLKEFL